MHQIEGQALWKPLNGVLCIVANFRKIDVLRIWHGNRVNFNKYGTVSNIKRECTTLACHSTILESQLICHITLSDWEIVLKGLHLRKIMG